jgi:hypothetical protein
MATKTENGAGDADVTKDEAPPSFYSEEENLKKLCNFLRSRDGPPVREALLMEKRVYYLKGKARGCERYIAPNRTCLQKEVQILRRKSMLAALIVFCCSCVPLLYPCYCCRVSIRRKACQLFSGTEKGYKMAQGIASVRKPTKCHRCMQGTLRISILASL